MIRHIVLFTIKDEYKADIPALVEGFYQMEGNRRTPFPGSGR